MEKGVDNFKRRTWDKAVYEKRAEMRARGEIDDEPKKAKIVSSKEEFKPADETATGPAGSSRAFIRSRENRVEFDNALGVSSSLAKTPSGEVIAGNYCAVCECTLKDSAAYLDHINGKRHQKKLGFSMRTERSTVDQVKQRLQSIKKKKETILVSESTILEYKQRLDEIEKEEQRKKQLRKEEKKEKKSKQKEELKTEEANVDPNIIEMLGFSGFGKAK